MPEYASAMARYEVQPLTDTLIDDAAQLLAQRHRDHRAACPALDVRFEDAAECAPLIRARLEQEGSLGAIAYSAGRPAGYALFTPRPIDQWGPNAWAEDTGNAGETESVREVYAAVAGALVEREVRGHWAMVPSNDAELNDGWFTMSFGMQHAYAFREPARADFQPLARPGLVVRRPEAADIPALAELDMVLPAHLTGSPVFSKLNPHTLEEAATELEEDLNNPKYSFWVAEHDGRVISTLVGVSVHDSSSWGPLMKPASAALLGFAATFPDGRGLGAGRALTEAFMAWARDEGYEWLVTDWRSTNLEANRTWRAMGFRPHFNRLFRAIP
jgi:GNAT superfamily N-acetyltransferase